MPTTTCTPRKPDITLEEWASADLDGRTAMLRDGRQLDWRGKSITNWARAFQEHGAVIPDEIIIATWSAAMNAPKIEY